MYDHLILRVLQILAASPDAAEDGVVASLVAEGVGRVRAEKLAALVPLAFGRALIAHMADVKFSMFAVVGHPNGERISLGLESMFTRAVEIATIMVHDGPRHLFEPAAVMSAEVQAINLALRSGVKEFKGAHLSDPVFMRLSARDWRDDG